MALRLLPLGSPRGGPWGPPMAPPQREWPVPAHLPPALRGPAGSAWPRLGWLGFGLAFGWLLLGFRLALAWISGGFWLRLDFGFVLVWLDLASGSILTGFQVNFGSIDALSLASTRILVHF